MAYLILFHALAAVIWVGGLFFLVGVLRPAATSVSLATRMALLGRAIGRFFVWSWLAIATLVVTGYAMVYALGGMGALASHVHLMQALGWLMFALFAHAYFAPWQRMRRALAVGALGQASRCLTQLRVFLWIDLALGLSTVTIATGGRYGLM